MEEMVEPDRTIMIVSIIGLVVIWGSFFYHKFVQGGSNAHPVESPEPASAAEAPEAAVAEPKKSSKKKSKKKR